VVNISFTEISTGTDCFHLFSTAYLKKFCEMKTLLILLSLPITIFAQSSTTEKHLVCLAITYPPDPVDSGEYYLVADRPSALMINKGQTFLLQSSWRKTGDSVVAIGAGTVQEINDYLGMRATLYEGKKVQTGDMACFLVPLHKPATDTLFFKMARLGIGFKSITDSAFYDRNKLLSSASSYTTKELLEAMAADIRFTGAAMLQQQDAQDQEIVKGNYKGKKLFEMMKTTTVDDVYQFIRYVYARPDRYRPNDWKISETFATWVINGAPRVL
jgi:hypothetical protein